MTLLIDVLMGDKVGLAELFRLCNSIKFLSRLLSYVVARNLSLREFNSILRISDIVLCEK